VTCDRQILLCLVLLIFYPNFVENLSIENWSSKNCQWLTRENACFVRKQFMGTLTTQDSTILALYVRYVTCASPISYQRLQRNWKKRQKNWTGHTGAILYLHGADQYKVRLLSLYSITLQISKTFWFRLNCAPSIFILLPHTKVNWDKILTMHCKQSNTKWWQQTIVIHKLFVK